MRLESMLSERGHRSESDFILEVVIHRTQAKMPGEGGGADE